jgi:hypothetical protein
LMLLLRLMSPGMVLLLRLTSLSIISLFRFMFSGVVLSFRFIYSQVWPYLWSLCYQASGTALRFRLVSTRTGLCFRYTSPCMVLCFSLVHHVQSYISGVCFQTLSSIPFFRFMLIDAVFEERGFVPPGFI